MQRSAPLILLLALALPVRAEVGAEILRAHQLGLAAHPTWQALLHVVRGKSEIPDEAFFLTEDGRTNPEGELEATLRGLLVPGSGQAMTVLALTRTDFRNALRA